jgi:RND family efflux transporter MFP subunit
MHVLTRLTLVVILCLPINHIFMHILQKLSKEQKLLVGIISIIVILVGVRTLSGGNNISGETASSTPILSKVSLYDPQNTEASASIPATGKIEALSDVDVRSQLSERVTRVPVSIGETVSVGTILATLNNQDYTAQANLAQANLNSAQAVLNETLRGTRGEQLDIARSQVQSAEVSFNNAKTSLQNSVETSYASIDDVISNKTDIIFKNPRSDSPALLFPNGDFQTRIDASRKRARIQDILEKDISTYTQKSAQVDLEQVKDYLQTLAELVNTITPSSVLSQSTIDLWKLNVSTSRSTINGSITSLLGNIEKSTLSESSLDIAKNQLTLAEAGATQEQLSAQEARVQAAQASLDASSLTLNKTIVRSPISGTVSRVLVSEGDLVTPGQIVATVVNTSGLKVSAYVNERSISLLNIGSPVYSNNNKIGTVTKIAPSVNPDTKKVEVEVAISQDAMQDLIIGQFISLEIGVSGDTATIPLSAIKTTSEGSFVYSVSGEQLLVAHPVVVEQVLGDRAKLQGDISQIYPIVENVRGLREGEMVEVI